MAITARHGRSSYFSASDAAGSTFPLSSGLDDLGLDRIADTAEITAFGDIDRAYLAGLRGATSSFSGHFDSVIGTKLDAMLGHTTDLTCVYGPAGNTAGYHKYKFQAFLTGMAISSPVGDKVSVAGGFQVTGTVTSTNF